MSRRLLLLFGLIFCALLVPRAHAATCITLSSGANQTTIQNALNSCGSGNTVAFSAGTYGPISSTVTIPCGVSMTGPVVPYSQTPNQTAIINGSSFNGSGFQSSTSCGTASSTIQYLVWNGHTPSNGGGFIELNAGTNNYTINNNWLYGANVVVPPGQSPNAGQIFICCVGVGGAVNNNITIEWNVFGNSSVSDCATVMNYTTSNIESNDGGFCLGVGMGGNETNVTVEFNIFRYLEQGTKSYSGPCCEGNPVYIQFNDYQHIARNDNENQVNYGATLPTLMYIDYNSWHDHWPGQNGVDYESSSANGCEHPTLQNPTNCVTHTDYNVFVETSDYTIAIEQWGASGTTASYNLMQGDIADGIQFASNGNFVDNNNTYQSANFGHYSTSCNPANPNGLFNSENQPNQIYIPTCTGNTSSSTTASITSAAPMLSFSSPTLTITNGGGTSLYGSNRDANTTVWCTTDGSTPTPGSGTAKPYWQGGTLTITTTTTVKCVGMWGAPNQPYSYPSTYGYTPSAVVQGTYSSASPAATPTFSPSSTSFSGSQSVTISDSTAGATIYYTTNGTTPTTSSSVYTGALSVSTTTTVQAIATASGFSQSAVGSATYTCANCVATPTVSVSGGTVTITTTTPGAGIWYTTDGSTPTLPPGGVPAGTSTGYTPMCQPITQPPIGDLKNITAYGAVSGGTDNTTAIANACTAAGNAQAGGPAAQTSGIYIPAGTWYYGNGSNAPTLNCNIYGQGQSSELYCPSPITGGGNCTMFSTGSNEVWSNFSHVFNGGARDATNPNIYFSGGSNNRTDTLLLKGGNAGGIFNINTSNDIDTNNGIIGTFADSNYHATNSGNVTNSIVDHEYVYGSGDDSISNVSYGNGTAYFVSGTLAQWNNLTNNSFARGISALGGQNFTFQNNLIANMTGAGFYLAQENPSQYNEQPLSNVIARYNYITNTDISGGQAGIMLYSNYPGQPGVSNLQLLGNYLASINSSASGSVLIDNASGATLNGVSFTNNTITGGPSTVWANSGTSTNFAYSGNTYNGSPSAGPTFGGTNPLTATGSPVSYSGCVVGTAKQYTGPFSASGTINAVAVFPGFANSAIGSGSTGPAAATPTFSPVSGTSFTGTQSVTLSDTTPSSTIYYYTSSPALQTVTSVGPTITDTNGYVWAINSSAQLTINTLPITNTSNVVEIAYVNGVIWQLNSSGNWYYETVVSPTVPTVNYAPPGGTTTSPIPAYSVYSAPISMSASTSISAYATASGYSNSPVANATYTFVPPTLTGGFQSNTPNVNTLAVGATAVQQIANGTYSDGVNRTLPDAYGNTAVWSSSAPTILNVTSTGLVSCNATGTANSQVQSAPGGVHLNPWTWTCTAGPSAATPVLTPASSSSFYPTQSVTITDSTSGATIYYTLDGSTPTTSSTVYSSALTLNATTTVKAMAVASGYGNSAVASGTYTYTTPTLTGATSTNSGAVTSIAIGGTLNQIGQCAYSAGPTYSCNTTDANGGKIISWASSNTAVFTVSSAGLVTGVGTGTANVTCQAQQGSSTPIPCTPYAITVVNSPPTLTGVTIALQVPPGGSTVTIGTPVQACGTLLYTGGITTTQCNNSADAYGTVLSAWNSSSPSNGTISSSGLVTGVANGTTNIKVTATNGSTTFTATPVTITINTAVVGANVTCTGCYNSGGVYVQ